MTEAKISYEEARALAAHQDTEVRAALARREDIPPEILYFLAEDAAPEVRRTIALNEVAPEQASLLLARDDHAGVRSDLAGKIARQPQHLNAPGQKHTAATHDALRILAKDLVPDVREMLADSIKGSAHAPVDVVKTLASDSKLEVCGPVLEHSPVLSEEDLIEIINSDHTPGALNFISRRDTVQERVTEAIVGADDVSAIADLLSNHGAQIREATLDDLVNRAEDIELWQAPICGRPALSDHAVGHLSNFVDDDLRKTLTERDDLDDNENDALITSMLKQHLNVDIGAVDLEIDPPGSGAFLRAELPLKSVNAIYSKNGLTAETINRALESQDYGFVLAALVIKAKCDENTARKIFAEKSTKGIVGLCMIAGFSPQLMVKVQQRMGRIAPSEVIMPEGDEPVMSIDDAEWQIKFYARLATQSS